jgi:hypothetical protein
MIPLTTTLLVLLMVALGALALWIIWRTTNQQKTWKVTTSANAPFDDANAILVLRLGLATTALRAAQRYSTLFRKDDESPGSEGSFVWSIMLTLAYLHELRVLLQPRFHMVRDLALQGGVDDDVINAVKMFQSGNSELGRVIEILRNELVFHFEEKHAMRNSWSSVERDGVALVHSTDHYWSS